MKNILNLILLLAGCQFLNAQSFETNYTKQYTSSNCGEEKFEFVFSNNILKRTDLYYNSSIGVPSRKEHTDFDNSGFYYEIWSPSYYLEQYGIDEYQKVNQYNYKVCFDKKGGELLYIFESDSNSSIKTGKFYFTQKGYGIFCTN